MAVESHTVGGVVRHELSGPLSKARGVVGREPAPGEEYVFSFSCVKPRLVHMVGVREPLEVSFQIVARGVIYDEETVTLQPWTGHARHPCNRIVERGVE